MKLLGRDITAEKLVSKLEARLRERGLLDEPHREPIQFSGVEPRVDPLSFNLRSLEENADPTLGMPLHTHRGGAGQVVVLAKFVFRKVGQVFINETLARQRVFNGHVRDSYAQLSAEVLRLREEVDRLRTAKAPISVEFLKLRDEVERLKKATLPAPRKSRPAAKKAPAKTRR